MKGVRIPYVMAVLVIAGALVAAAFVAPVRGKPLPASVDLPYFKNFDGTGTRLATGDERELSDSLIAGLTQASNHLFSQTPGWSCVRAAKLLDKWVVEITSTVWTPDPAANDGVWGVAVSVRVKTKSIDIWPSRLRRAVPRGASVVITATDELRDIMTELEGKIKPCEAKIKVRGRQSAVVGGAGNRQIRVAG